MNNPYLQRVKSRSRGRFIETITRGFGVEQKKIWSHFQNHRQSVFAQADSRHRFLFRHLPRGRILNVGIGDGGFERLAASAGRHIYSLDLDLEGLGRIARARIANAVGANVSEMPFADASFDAVICSEVLEHLDDDLLHKGLAEIRRVLKPGGELRGTVPADENLQDSETVCPHCGAVFHRWGHVQSFSEQRLKGLMEASIGRSCVQRRLFASWRNLNWKGKLGASARLMLMAVGSHGSGDRFYFAAQKHQGAKNA